MPLTRYKTPPKLTKQDRFDAAGVFVSLVVFALAAALLSLLGSVTAMAIYSRQWWSVLILLVSSVLPIHLLIGARRLWSDSIVLVLVG